MRAVTRNPEAWTNLVGVRSRLYSSAIEKQHRPYESKPFGELLMNGGMFWVMSKGMSNWAVPMIEASIGKSKIVDSAIEFGLRHTAIKMFFGGVGLDEASQTAIKLGKQGVQSIFDYSPEGGDSQGSEYYNEISAQIVKTIERAGELSYGELAHIKPAVAIKIPEHPEFMERVSDAIVNQTELSARDQKRWQELQGRTLRIFQAAEKNGIDVLVDGEWSYINPSIDKIVDIAREKGCNPIDTVQCYLKDSPKKFEQIVEREGKIKMVRGAYIHSERERASVKGYESPVFGTKDDTDANYDKLMELGISSGKLSKLIVATHNDDSARKAAELKEKYPSSEVTLATLYGMPVPAVAKLKKAAYLPFVNGVLEGFPYFARRTQENAGAAGKKGVDAVKQELSHRWQDFVYGQNRDIKSKS